MFSTLKPVSYEEVAAQRKSTEYMTDRVATEKPYHDLLPEANQDQSFLYATLVGYHKMDNPTTYPGFTYYFHLDLAQVEQTVFHVVYGDKSTKPTKGLNGLVVAMNLWKKHHRRFKSVMFSRIFPFDEFENEEDRV